MKTLQGKSVIALAILSALSLSACNVDLNVDGQPVAKLSTTKTGVIVDLSKGVKINDVNYDTSQATVMVNGQQSDLSALKQGMLVSVSGTENSDGTGVAKTIYYEDDVKGAVASNNVAPNTTSGTLQVMGQTVRIDDKTVFESFDVSDLGVSDIDKGNVVEVSGYSSGDGEIWATRIEVKDTQYNDGDEIALKGNISNLTSTSFAIGNQIISTENAILDNDFMGVLKDGQYVEVKSYNGFDADGILLASEIDLKGEGTKEVRHTESDEQVEIKGIITNNVNTGELEVNGTIIAISQNAQISASTLGQLDKGKLVEVEGYIDANGKLVATKVELETESGESNESGIDDDDSRTSGSSGTDDSRSSRTNDLDDNTNDRDSSLESNEFGESEHDND